MADEPAQLEGAVRSVPLGGWDRVFELTPIPTAVMHGRHFAWVNQAYSELIGLPVDDIVGEHFDRWFQDDIIDQVDGAAEAVARGERRFHFEGSLITADGRRRWVSNDAVLVGDPGDGIALSQATDLTDLHHTRTELAASERRFRSLLSNISDTVSLLSAEGELLFTTGALNNALGYDAAFWSAATPLQLVHHDDLDRVAAAWELGLASPGVEITAEARMRTASGEWDDIVFTGVNLLHDPDVGGCVLTSRNITKLRRAERLASSQASVLELIARGAALDEILDACLKIADDNRSTGTSAVFLLEGDRLVPRAGTCAEPLADWLAQAPRHPTRSICDRAMATRSPAIVTDLAEDPVNDSLQLIAASVGFAAGWSQPILSSATGEPIGSFCTVYPTPRPPTPHERVVGEVMSSLIAIAIERVESETRLAHQALHDGLTGLPNRTLLLDRLDHALRRRATTGHQIALLFCDVDRFKVINDSLGHGVGDELLVAFSERVVATVRAGDTVARFGGDEFVILIEDDAEGEAPIRLAEQIAAALEAPFVLPSGQEVYLTVSIGLALAGDHQTGDGWLRDADAAMYRAKERGRNRLELFDTDMRHAAMVRLQVEHDLRRAVTNGELVIHYQPVIDLPTGAIRGLEALVRWQHPVRGLLSPGDFIAIAEDTGAITEIGAHILDLAVAGVSQVQHLTGGRPLQLAVNVSGRQLGANDLDRTVADVCAAHGWPHEQLVLEITETAIAQGPDGPIEVLDRIHDLGVGLAIDDFGTGYSSLTRLGAMPVGQVKIDQSFVAAIDNDDDRRVRIVDAVVAIAGALGLQTTAEGVESQAQLDYLRRIHCERAQGYLFAKPLPLDELAALLESDPRW